MDIFPTQNKEPNTLIQKDIDAEKYQAIAAKLCTARKKLEDTLQETAITPDLREEKALALTQARQSLQIFGITEIDYQAYLAYQEQESSQLELF
jgi:hypothetical protein